MSRHMTKGEEVRHTTAVGKVVISYLATHQSASVNELCRECLKAGLSVTKPFIASVRRQILAAAQKDENLYVGANGEPHLRVSLLEPMTRVAQALEPTPEELERTRVEKAAREAERAEKWKARLAEKEAEWAREREEEKRREEEARAMTQEKTPSGDESPQPVAEAPKREAPVVVPPVKKSRSAAIIAERRQYLNQMLDEDPGIDPVVALGRLREKFGAGLSNIYVYETCRIAREIHGLPTIARRNDEAGRAFNGREPMPTFPVLEAEDDEAFATTPEEDLAWLARQCGDIMRQHNLVSTTIAMGVDPVTGERSAEWEFEVAPRTGRGSLKF